MRKLIVVATILVAGLLAPGAANAQTPAGTEWQEHYVASADGTKLHIDLLLPKDRAPADRLGVLRRMARTVACPRRGPTRCGEAPRARAGGSKLLGSALEQQPSPRRSGKGSLFVRRPGSIFKRP